MARKSINVLGKPNWKNRTLFHGDNLKFLRGMNSASVDLIATDPPFNKGRDFHATPDSLAAGARFQDRWSWERDVHEAWVDEITDDFPDVMTVIRGARSSYGDDMGAFLCFMAVRLLEMRRVLKPTGSIYLHCDPTASHYLKQLMDAVFGCKQFRNEIVWQYGKMSNTSRNFPSNHDLIFRYSKTDDYTFNVIKGAESEYRNRYKRYLQRNKVYYGAVKNSRDKLILGRCKKIRKTLGRDLRDNDVLFNFDSEFKVQSDVIYCSIIKGNSAERTGYPTQKPISLYDRLIRASSNANAVVLDPFAGCATTLVAAERLGRKWVGIDIWGKVYDVVLDRLRKEWLAAEGHSAEKLAFGEVHFTSAIPTRTDDGHKAVVFMKVPERTSEPEGKRMSRTEMYGILLEQRGPVCQGCDRVFDDPRYLQLDHNTPRSDGGLNHITNRVLLCGPCNRAKSNIYTLSGLRHLNKKKGWMA